MELKDFIKGTISDIAMAIKELNNEVSNTGLLVNPDNHEQDKAGNSSFIGDGRIIKDIEFNLSLSASDITEAGGLESAMKPITAPLVRLDFLYLWFSLDAVPLKGTTAVEGNRVWHPETFLFSRTDT